ASFDWAAILADADWLHLSGITPALGANAAESALCALRAASEAGVRISFDGNYRVKLWAGRELEAPAILKELLSYADLAFVTERDLAMIFGREFADRNAAFQAAFDAFPRLQFVAATVRAQSSVDSYALSGGLTTRSGEWRSRLYELSGVIDRIGAGDAFAAGVLHGLTSGADAQYTVDFATAAAVFKHSIPGDFSIATCDEIERSVNDVSLDVRR
ncbi:MAG: PfkB family carbohydrate kinase, partial [Amphiplicatus sp.]